MLSYHNPWLLDPAVTLSGVYSRLHDFTSSRGKKTTDIKNERPPDGTTAPGLRAMAGLALKQSHPYAGELGLNVRSRTNHSRNGGSSKASDSGSRYWPFGSISPTITFDQVKSGAHTAYSGLRASAIWTGQKAYSIGSNVASLAYTTGVQAASLAYSLGTQAYSLAGQGGLMASQWLSQPSQQGTKKDEGDWQSLLSQEAGHSLDSQSRTDATATDGELQSDSTETDFLLSQYKVPGAF